MSIILNCLQDLFASSYGPFPAPVGPVPGWQTGYSGGLGISMPYNTAMVWSLITFVQQDHLFK